MTRLKTFWCVCAMAGGFIGSVASSSVAQQVTGELALIPIYGQPYTSTRSDGSTPVIGTIDLDIQGFSVENGGIVVSGRLLRGRHTIETTFPVEIVGSSCEILQLEIGPPSLLNLQDPLFVEETAGESELRRADFCAITAALQRGDLDTVVSELNEDEELQAGLLGEGSCPFLEKLECGGLIIACSALCIDPADGVCEACFIGAGAGGCWDCLFRNK